MKSRRVIRLTEGDLHRIIRKTVNRLNEEDKKEKDWTKSYDEWSETYGDKAKGEKLSDDWHEKLKKEYPNKKERRKAINRHCKELDVKNGKTGGKWDKYDKDMNESVRRIVRRAVNEIIDNVPGYYVCVDTDYSNGCRAECFIGDEHDAKALSMSSEGYAEGPFMSEREAIEAMKKIQGQYNY